VGWKGKITTSEFFVSDETVIRLSLER